MSLPNKAGDGEVWVCAACGKVSRTRMPTDDSDIGWDESCMLKAVLCSDAKVGGKWKPTASQLSAWEEVDNEKGS